jgi:hypothetical protein
MIRTLAAAVVAFVVGMQLAGGKTEYGDVAKGLVERQKKLFGDIERIEQARKDLLEVMATRKEGKFILNKEEIRLEKSSRSHLHIFMERFRNDTLETLALYDRLVANKALGVLEAAYGKKLTEIVEVAWREEGLEAISDQLGEAYGVNLFIKGNVDVNRTMSLVGEMSLAAIFEHIANTFQVKVINDDGELWFTKDKSKPAPDDLFED